MLAAAEEVFAERGIEAASVDHVAAAAGLTKGAIYSNFRGKDDLVLALMAEHVARRQRAAAEAMDSALEGADALRDAGKQLVTAIRSDARWQRLLISYALYGTREPAVRDALQEERRELRAALAGLIERVAERFGLRLRFTPDEAAVIVLALSNGFAVESSIDPDAVPDDLFGRVLATLTGS